MMGDFFIKKKPIDIIAGLKVVVKFNHRRLDKVHLVPILFHHRHHKHYNCNIDLD